MQSKQSGTWLRLCIAAVTAGGLAVLAYGAAHPTGDRLGALLTLVILGALAERYAIGLFDSHVSVGVVAVLVAAVLAGFWGVALVAPAIVLAGELGTNSAWYKRVYNAGVYLLAGAAFAGVYQAFGKEAEPDAWPAVLAPALLGAVANFAVNSGLVTLAVALTSGEPLVTRWRRSYQWLLPHYLVVGLAAMAMATAYHVLGLWGLAVFAAPVASIRHAYFQGAKVSAVRVKPEHDLARAA